MQDLATLTRQYYGHPAVRERILEFLGRSFANGATAVYVCGTDGTSDPCAVDPMSVGRLDELLRQGVEIGRSLWDRKYLIADLDIDYENFNSASEAYINPDRTFRILQPVLDATINMLQAAGIKPLHLTGGRGHHFVWAISRTSPAFDYLARLGTVAPTLMEMYAKCADDFGEVVSPSLARAFTGLGMLLEFVAHRTLQMASSSCPVPVELTSVEVGPINDRREIVSLDISEYGDPLHLRHIRVPFSVYLKPNRLVWCLGEEGVRRLLPIFEIPAQETSINEALRARTDPESALKIAVQSDCSIPDASEATLSLLHEYVKSDLADFHRRFYSDESVKGPTETSSTSQSLDMIPLCTRWVLEHPNDWLLKPGGVQHVTRTLMALGWRPREIAELVRTRYQEDFDWKDRWHRYDAASRALFYVRLFSGLIETGDDQLIDFNCVSHQEKGFCTVPNCTGNLVPYQQLLLRRRQRA